MSRLGIEETLGAMPSPNFPAVQVDARNALARALRPEFVGINPQDYLDVTDEHLDLAAPELLRQSLIGVAPGSPDAVAYRVSRQELLYVAVTPTEFGLMSGSVLALGQRAVAGSQRKRQRIGKRNPVDDAAAERAGVHAVMNRAVASSNYLENVLVKQDKLIAQFQEAARYPGLARFGSEGVMREELTNLRTFVFGSLLTAIGNQRQWTAAQQQRAQKAVDARIFLDRHKNNHINNFKGMLDLASEWTGYKRAVIATRLWESKKYIQQHTLNDR